MGSNQHRRELGRENEECPGDFHWPSVADGVGCSGDEFKCFGLLCSSLASMDRHQGERVGYIRESNEEGVCSWM